MIITENQKERLQSLLTRKEYLYLMSFENNLGDFQTELDDFIISRFDENDENTPQAEELQCIYDEIYNQN
jgi:hypothetical protein